MSGVFRLLQQNASVLAMSLGGVVIVVAAILGFRAWQRSRVTPEEWERRRRAMLATQGKMGDAVLVDIRGDLLFYSYDVRGVEYTASQDVSHLHECVPADLSTVAALAVKYDARNPANSIILAEGWSGIRAKHSS